MGDEDKAAAPEAADKAAEDISAKEEVQDQQSFWLVVIKDATNAPPTCIRCDSEESLAEAVSANVLDATKPLYAFAFRGDRLQLSAPRPVCSVQIGGEKIDVGRSADEFDESGRIKPLRRAESN